MITIVTGGAGGIGRGICEVLAGRGHQVVATDIVAEETDVAADGTAPNLEGITIQQLDITDTAAVDRFVAGVVAEYGRIDGLVNNAAVGPLGTVAETDDATLDEILAVNVKGTFAMSRAVLPAMIARQSGAIVNIGSGAGHGKANMAAYAASKAAVHALTTSMAYDHFSDQVRVNTVIPGGGGIPSGISLSRFGGSAADYLALPHTGSVAGRPVKPQDVGQAVAFLLGPEAAAVSGTVIDVGCMANQGGPLPAQSRPVEGRGNR